MVILLNSDDAFLFENRLFFELPQGDYTITSSVEPDSFFKFARVFSFVSVCLCFLVLLSLSITIIKIFIKPDHCES